MMKQYLWTFIFVLLGAVVTTASSSYGYKYVFYAYGGGVWQLWSSYTPQSSWSSPVAANDPSFTVASSSAVAATNAKNTLYMYYQDTNGNIVTQDAIDGRTWSSGTIIVSSTTALAGTGLGAVCYPDTTLNHLFFQDNTGHLRHIYLSTSGWVLDSTFSYAAQSYTPITAAAWNSKQIRVYYIGTNGEIYQLDWGGSTWANAIAWPHSATYLQLAAYYPFNAGSGINVYFVNTIVQKDLNILTWGTGSFSTSTLYSLSTIPGGISALYDNSTYSYVYLQNSAYTIQELYVTSTTSYSVGTTMSVALGAAANIASTLR